MKIKKILTFILVVMISFSIVGCSKEEEHIELDDSETLMFNLNYNDLTEESTILDYMLDALKLGGKTFISSTLSNLAKEGFNYILQELGFDTRSVQDKKLDEINEKVTKLQSTVEEGFDRVLRKQTQIYNEDIMEELLDKVEDVKTPVLSKMATLAEISRKELEGVDEATLNQEKLTFYKGLQELSFVQLSTNKLWNATENFANSITTPRKANISIKLFDLYEETYGGLETWDYMTIKPRTEFITYLSFLANSMCELAKILASYEISLLPEGDSNIKDIETGVQAMVTAVNNMNEMFQTELLKLDQIKKDHDENKLMTRRERTIDANGNIVITRDIVISSHLLPVTPQENDYNYVTFKHNDGVVFDRHPGGDNDYYYGYFYTLNCESSMDLYSKIIDEYKVYCASRNLSDYTTVTIKDYLAIIGFDCKDVELYKQAKGLYSYMAVADYEAKGGFINHYNQFGIAYYSFSTRTVEGDIYDTVRQYKSWIFGGTDWEQGTNDNLYNYYLCFVSSDQKTIYGTVKRTDIKYYPDEDIVNNFYGRHYKGYKLWDGNYVAAILEKHQ